jgi:general nucleoside transport system permease protein
MRSSAVFKRGAAVGSAASQLVWPVLAVVIALLAGAALIAASGHDPLAAYAQLYSGAVGDPQSLGESLRVGTTVIFVALAFTVGFRAGVYNIGLQGQLLVGALAAAWVGFSFQGLPGPLLITVALVAGGLGGAAWNFVPAFLRARFGVNEIVTTFLASFVGGLLTQYLVIARFNSVAGETTATPFISPSAQLPLLLPPSHLSWAIFLGLGLVALYAVARHRTKLGYELEMIGLNSRFSAYGGLNISRGLLIALLVSGLIAGLAGAQAVLGDQYRFVSSFEPQAGIDGIIAALLGRSKPVGIVVAGVFIGGLENGALNMEVFTGVPRSAIAVVTSVIVLLAASSAPSVRADVGRLIRRARTSMDQGPPAGPQASDATAEEV